MAGNCQGLLDSIPGIKGNVADKLRAGWLEIQSIQYDVHREITSSSSTQFDRESINAAMGDLRVTRFMDSATPSLFLESCCGRGQTIIAHLTKTGQGTGAQSYAEIIFKHALICRYTTGGHYKYTRRPLEMISFSFTAMEFKYQPFDDDGLALSPMAVGFDTATNTKS
ncbi:MAG: type VI secretion system tube protein Hcp [Gammaproteobacteria bacterium]|nr:type VI secretion system tube protein Hcp [Gammaproteobacteria bacterium]